MLVSFDNNNDTDISMFSCVYFFHLLVYKINATSHTYNILLYYIDFAS